MKIPSKLKIGGHTVSVTVLDKVADDGRVGEWDETKNTIKLLDAVQSQKEVTLLHEILHAINIIMEHEKLEYLSQALYQVIVDNKLHFDGKDEK